MSVAWLSIRVSSCNIYSTLQEVKRLQDQIKVTTDKKKRDELEELLEAKHQLADSKKVKVIIYYNYNSRRTSPRSIYTLFERPEGPRARL